MELVLNDLTDKAMSLSIDERTVLAQRLWESIENFVDTDVEEAWLSEAEKRWKDIEEDKVQCIPAEDVMERARTRLRIKQ